MRLIHKILVAAAIVLVPGAVNAQDTTLVTLDEAIKIAISENASVRVADKEIEREQYAKKGTYSA